jgi:arsenate reductase
MKKSILFICTHNASRSQIAEGLVNHLYGDKYTAHSAGTNPTTVNPFVIRVMEEVGIDVSAHQSKSIEVFSGRRFDFVVTVCDTAKETCPYFPGDMILHKSFEDPSTFQGTDEEVLDGVRRVRDEIAAWLAKTFVWQVKKI